MENDYFKDVSQIALFSFFGALGMVKKAFGIIVQEVDVLEGPTNKQ